MLPLLLSQPIKSVCSLQYWMITSFTHLPHTKYCYQRSHINSRCQRYGLALHYYIFSRAVSLERKQITKPQNMIIVIDDPVVTLPQSNHSSPREGAVGQGVSLAHWGQELGRVIFFPPVKM